MFVVFRKGFTNIRAVPEEVGKSCDSHVILLYAVALYLCGNSVFAHTFLDHLT